MNVKVWNKNIEIKNNIFYWFVIFITNYWRFPIFEIIRYWWKKVKRKVQGVPQSQTTALPRPQEEEETDKSKQAQTEQTHVKHQDYLAWGRES